MISNMPCFLTYILGHSGRYFIPVEDSTEETLWNNGGKCEESIEGIRKLIFFFFGLHSLYYFSETKLLIITRYIILSHRNFFFFFGYTSHRILTDDG